MRREQCAVRVYDGAADGRPVIDTDAQFFRSDLVICENECPRVILHSLNPRFAVKLEVYVTLSAG